MANYASIQRDHTSAKKKSPRSILRKLKNSKQPIPLKRFTLFPNLPIEIRRLIWLAAIPSHHLHFGQPDWNVND